MKRLNYLVNFVENKEIEGSLDKDIESICYDSRKCTKNALFVAIKGTYIDANNFIPNAILNGSVAIIHEGIVDYSQYENVTFIKVPNSRIALAKISNAWFDFPSSNISLFGVTGTNGKTTCTFIIKSLLESVGQKSGIIGTTGNYIGNLKIPSTHTTPESLELFGIIAKMQVENAKCIVMEASSHALHQNRVFGLNFDGAIFTNLTHEHLDYHITMEDYAKAKLRLFEMLKPDGIAILNADDNYLNFFKDKIKRKIIFTVGRNVNADFIIKDEKVNLTYSEYSLIDKKNIYSKKPFLLRSKLIGRFNIDNTAQSFVQCLAKGIDPHLLIEKLENANGAPGRMQREVLSNGAVGIVDYAHTPDALDKALKTCREILKYNDNRDCKIICVFGCGGDRDKTKRPMMGKIATELSDFTIITNDNPRTEDPQLIFKDILNGIAKEYENKYKLIPDRTEAIAYAFQLSKVNDIILITGKGHEDYQIIGTEKHHFNDLEELLKYK